MCEPLTIAAAATAVVAGGVSAYSQYQQGRYAGRVADQNAEIAEGEAARALQRGAQAAGVKRMETSLEVGEARARAGATEGIDLTSESSLDAIADARMMSELDAQTISSNAALEAWGYKVQATGQRAQARGARYAGKMGAATTLIGAASQAASIGMSYKVGTTAPGGTTTGVLL